MSQTPTMEPDPSNAARDEGAGFSGWPDWNSAYGTGKTVQEANGSPVDEHEGVPSFDEIYQRSREGARELRESKKPVHESDNA